MPNAYSVQISELTQERRDKHEEDKQRVAEAAAAATADELQNEIEKAAERQRDEQVIADAINFEAQASADLLKIMRDALPAKAAAASS